MHILLHIVKGVGKALGDKLCRILCFFKGVGVAAYLDKQTAGGKLLVVVAVVKKYGAGKTRVQGFHTVLKVACKPQIFAEIRHVEIAVVCP